MNRDYFVGAIKKRNLRRDSP